MLDNVIYQIKSDLNQLISNPIQKVNYQTKIISLLPETWKKKSFKPQKIPKYHPKKKCLAQPVIKYLVLIPRKVFVRNHSCKNNKPRILKLYIHAKFN